MRKFNFKDFGAQKPPSTYFDISKRHSFDCYPGHIIPAFYRYVYPNDKVDIGHKIVVRLSPLVSPSWVKMEAVMHYFYVPFRILWRDWEEYITKGADGTYNGNVPRMVVNYNDDFYISKYSFWDYLGLPYFNGQADYSQGNDRQHFDISNVSDNIFPHNFLWSAYNFIWNDYYRDENLQNPLAYYMVGFNASTRVSGEIPHPNNSEENFLFKYDNFFPGLPIYSLEEVDGKVPVFVGTPYNSPATSLRLVNFRKDYFTSALPFQQRGVAPALPVTGSIDVNATGLVAGNFQSVGTSFITEGETSLGIGVSYPKDNNATHVGVIQGSWTNQTGGTDSNISTDIALSKTFLNALSTQGGVSGFSLSAPEMYLLFALQRWQTITARAGIRYNEFLYGLYGNTISDYRIQRPIYLGGSRQPIMISEVLQTSQTTQDSELGQYAGYGLSVSSDKIDDFYVNEFGVILGLFHITYEPLYTTSMPRELMNTSVYDWYFPQFANLADQAILEPEVFYNTNLGSNEIIFGYQGKYDELRTSFNTCAGAFRTEELGNWVARRDFDTAPVLNDTYIQVAPDSLQDLFQVQDKPPFFVHIDSFCGVRRGLPYFSSPGLVNDNKI